MTTACFITARLKSTRLPRKALKPILGRPMIAYLVERMKLSRRIDRIVLCTSTVAQDDPLERFADSVRIDCYRGDPDDVLARLVAAAEEFEVDDLVASCTADNPFVDPVSMDELIDFHRAGGYDYARSTNLPWGAFTSTISCPAMVRACRIKTTNDTEVWGGYFIETGLFHCGELAHTDASVARPALRLTVDEPDDFELVRRIAQALQRPGEVFGLSEIVALLDSDPHLAALNATVVQKTAKPIELKSELAAV